MQLNKLYLLPLILLMACPKRPYRNEQLMLEMEAMEARRIILDDSVQKLHRRWSEYNKALSEKKPGYDQKGNLRLREKVLQATIRSSEFVREIEKKRAMLEDKPR